MSSSREAPELVHVTSTSAAHIAVSVMPPSDNMMLRWRSTVAKTWFKTLVREGGSRFVSIEIGVVIVPDAPNLIRKIVRETGPAVRGVESEGPDPIRVPIHDAAGRHPLPPAAGSTTV